MYDTSFHLIIEVWEKKIPNPLKAPPSAAPKVPEFCPEVEGNPVPLGEPVVCKLGTLINELSVLGWELISSAIDFRSIFSVYQVDTDKVESF